MSRARHNEKHRADGGKVEPEVKPKPYNAEGSEVEKEAEEKAHGGRAKKKRGGAVEGGMKKHRLDRPGRKTGGRIGADKSPLTTAAKIRPATEHNAEDSGDASEGP